VVVEVSDGRSGHALEPLGNVIAVRRSCPWPGRETDPPLPRPVLATRSIPPRCLPYAPSSLPRCAVDVVAPPPPRCLLCAPSSLPHRAVEVVVSPPPRCLLCAPSSLPHRVVVVAAPPPPRLGFSPSGSMVGGSTIHGWIEIRHIGSLVKSYFLFPFLC
jgi:hypothetical protein